MIQPSLNPTVRSPVIFLTQNDVKKQLPQVPGTSCFASDTLPNYVLEHGCEILTPLVHHLFMGIL